MFSRIFIILCLFVATAATAQQQFKSEKRSITKSATINVSEIEKDFFPRLSNLEAPNPNGDSYRDYLEQVKAKIGPAKNIFNYKEASAIEDPIVGMSFEGNNEKGTPNDNDMAISNDGWLVSVVNSAVYMKQVDDSSIPATEVSLEEFASTLSEFNDAFDPKVSYDPLADRFVLMFLNGRDEESVVVVAFSQSNNPTGAWNIYEITGSPFEENTWTDFPMIALTEDDFFLTVNLLFNGQGWEEGFVETIVWQMDKESAYAGEPLETKLWSQAELNGMPIRNAIPVQAGSSLAGPNLFLLSNRNFDPENDTIFLMEITGNANDDNAEFIVQTLTSPVAYGVPPNARASAVRTLQTNDARILGAYYEENIIHFVGMTNVFDTNIPGIYHGIINDPGLTNDIEATVLTSDLEYGYPNLSFSGKSPEDNQFILTFSYCSPTVRPGHAAIQYNFGEYSDLMIIKEGETHIGPINVSPVNPPGPQRWGDYSGSQPRYNQLGTVWTSGTYGKANQPNYLFGATWIAELGSQIENTVGVETITNNNQAAVFPNPVREMINIEFELAETQTLRFQLIDANGRLVKNLLQGKAKEGKNLFTFSVHSLPSGNYTLNVLSNKNNKQNLLSKQIVVH